MPMDTEMRVDALIERWEALRDQGTSLTPEALCADAPELIDEVRRRIEALRDMERVLGPEGTGDACGGEGRAQVDPPYAAGGHRILGRHGIGGLGIVFTAREESLGRTVALKRIRPDRLREPARRRFLREATLTAGLQHPGIVPIYALGRDEDGPFYTMPLIEGCTLQQAIDAHHNEGAPRPEPPGRGLRPRELLQHFVAACNTVAYAHDQGVVHRDLKPSNLMIGRYGETLVMDWGLAKRFRTGEGQDEGEAGEAGRADTDSAAGAPESSPGPAEEVTAVGEVLGTPQYMSPEQARGEPAGPAGDIFSLGLILYAIITGKCAFGGARFCGPDGLRAVRTASIVPPRRRDPRISRDLEAICLKALAARPEDRYASARDLAEDVARWMSDEPVAVRREPVVARARRWGRRHRTAVAASAAGLATLALGLAVAAVVLARANDRLARARDETLKSLAAARAAEARAGAALVDSEGSRQQAEAVAGFLVEALRSPDPAKVGRDVRMADVLDGAARRLDAGFAATPSTRAAMLDALGQTYQGLGDYARAEALLRRALADRTAALGPAHPDSLRTRNHLASVHLDAGRSAEALALYREALDLAGATLGPDDPVSLGCRANLANAQLDTGRIAEAMAMHEDVLRRRLTVLGPDHPDTLASRQNLAIALRAAGRPAEAVALDRLTVERMTVVLGPDHPDTLRCRSNLAIGYRAVGRAADRETIELDEGTLRLRQVRLGPDHPDTLASRQNLAIDYWEAGRTDDAIALMASTLELQVARIGPDHRDALMSRNNLAAAYQESGRIAEAIPLHEETLRRREAVLGPDHPHTFMSRINLGLTYREAGRLAEAIALLDETSRRLMVRPGPDHPFTLTCRAGLGGSYLDAGRPCRAIAVLEDTVARREARLGAAHPDTLDSRNELAAAYRAAGRLDSAERLHRETIARRRGSAGPDGFLLAVDLAAFARDRLEQSLWPEAESLLRESLALLERSRRDDWRRYEAASLLGAALLAQGREADARPPIVEGYRAMKDREARISPRHRARLREAAERVIALFERLGPPAEAAAWKTRLGMADLPVDVFTRP